MNINEVGRMIRSSIRRHLRESISSRRRPPVSFFDFRTRLIAEMISSAAATQDLVERLDDSRNEIFEHAWDAFEGITSELRGLTAEERSSTYKEVAPDYIRQAVSRIVDSCADLKRLRREGAASALAESVVRAMT